MITINLDKARETHRSNIRYARASLLNTLDVEFQRALENNGDTSEIVAKKNLLRDAPQNPAIDSASTAQELKSSWDEPLLGPSPYSQV